MNKTQLNQTKQLPIDIGAAPTQAEHKTDRNMTGRCRCGPEIQTQNLNWQDEWPIDIGAVLTQT